MENRGWIRIVLAALVGLGLIILIIVVISKIFGGGSKAPIPTNLADYSNTASTVTLLVDAAPTQIDQDHRQVRITVSQTQNQIEVMQGYQGNLLNTRTYSNNSAAYGVFLQSLKLMNFSKGSSDKALADYRGACPFGDRYVFTFNDGQSDLFKYWATSCKVGGTFQGSTNNVLRLIRLQIPQKDWAELTSRVSLGF